MSDSDVKNTEGQPSIASAVLFGLCPRCGDRSLFAGSVAHFAEKCRACGLSFRDYNVGDGPAAFLTLIIGALVTALALWVQSAFHPPFWVHIVLWVPITAAAVIWGLRAGKAALLGAEVQRDAGEGQIAKAGEKDE